MQTLPDYLSQLIEQAAAHAGSEYKLAKLIGVPQQNLSAWKHGRKSCPVADQVLMADIAGLKPEEWAARALIAQHQGTEKGDKLYKALSKLVGATGAALVSFGASAHPIFSHDGIRAAGQFIRCILLLSRRQQSAIHFTSPRKRVFL